MQLMIMTPGGTTIKQGTQRQLVSVVKADLESHGLPQDQIRRHLYSLGVMVGGIGGANVTDAEGNLIAGYRITR